MRAVFYLVQLFTLLYWYPGISRVYENILDTGVSGLLSSSVAIEW